MGSHDVRTAATLLTRPALWIALCSVWWCTPLAAQVPFQDGDVFAAVTDGKIRHFDRHGKLRQLIDVTSDQQAGMCFDASGKLYVTNFSDQTMSKIDSDGRVLVLNWGGPFSTSPESCVVDGDGNIYTGEVDGESRIRKYNPDGRFLASFDVALENRGTDWIDLAADQCTMYYTSESDRIKRFNICTNQQMRDFASGLGNVCFALRLRRNGELMVACQTQIYRLDGNGSVQQRYTISDEFLFAMNLDPDGVHFWTAGHFTGNIYKVNIETGAGTDAPLFSVGETRKSSGVELLDFLRNAVAGQTAVGGLAVYGEPTVAKEVAIRKPPPPPPQEVELVESEPEPQEVADVESTPEESAEPPPPPEPLPPPEPPPPPPPPPEPLNILRFGPIPAVDFDQIESKSETPREIDLTAAEVDGEPVVSLTTNLDLGGVVLEVETPEGWQTLGDTPVWMPWSAALSRLPVRLRVGRCPEGSAASDSHVIQVEGPGANGQVARSSVPLRVVVEQEPWLRCWWPLLTLLSSVILGVLLIHGFVSPSRFASRIGVMLSPEEDMDEGFFYPIKDQRGSGSGFYRDARVFITPDFRISGKSAGAVVRLRADPNQVRIQPMPGTTVLRRTADDDWEPLPPEEKAMRFGTVYCNELRTIFFEIRNG